MESVEGVPGRHGGYPGVCIRGDSAQQGVMVGGFCQHQALCYLPHPTVLLTAFLVALYPSLIKKCHPHGLLLSPPTCCPVTLIPAFAGNRGFMDIMDMPNTNKYSFDG